ARCTAPALRRLLPAAAARGGRGGGGGALPFRWQEGRGTRIGVVPRRGGAARWFDVPACQLLHTANAFERDGRLVVDGIRTDRFLSDMAADPPTLYRWEIDLAGGVVTEGAVG